MSEEKKHPGGRPPRFNTPEELDQMVDLYVASRTAMEKPMNVVDLTLFLGFANKQSVYEYAKNPKFSNSMGRALSIVEEGHLDRVVRGVADKGNIFVLKASYGYQEKQVIEMNPITVNIEGKDALL